MSLNRVERNNYEYRPKAIRDEVSAKEYMKEEGLKEGIEQGKNLGMREQKIIIARKLLRKNINIEFIKDVTSLTEEEIKKI